MTGSDVVALLLGVLNVVQVIVLALLAQSSRQVVRNTDGILSASQAREATPAELEDR